MDLGEYKHIRLDHIKPFFTMASSYEHTIKQRSHHERIFVNRSLHLEKIKFFGFDMDYTIAVYKSPDFESIAFKLVKERLVEVGYPKEINEYFYDPTFPVRGLWFDTETGNLLKVDSYGNILTAVCGFKFLSTAEIFAIYPNKFLQMDEQRIYVLNTLFTQPEVYLLACVINFFHNSPNYKPWARTGNTPLGVKTVDGNLFMSYKSIHQDIRCAFDWLHGQNIIKKLTIEAIDKYVEKDDKIPILFERMRISGKKTFLLTNSDYNYTEKIMSYLFDTPSARGRDWKTFFDHIVVDARKPLFFSEGTTMRQVNTNTGALKIGTHTGPIQPGQVYSGGCCDIFTEMIGAFGKDVLYCGDHIYGDILKSKKIRGWRTFLVVPELMHELETYVEMHEQINLLGHYDAELSALYNGMDSSSQTNPNTAEVRKSILETCHKLDMSYGMLGSIFRSGSRQTHFATQVSRYADLYSSTYLNLLHYPFSYFFRAPKMMMPHETTAEGRIREISSRTKKNTLFSEKSISMRDRVRSLEIIAELSNVRHSGRKLYADQPKVVTHHHDDDDDELGNGTNVNGNKQVKMPPKILEEKKIKESIQTKQIAELEIKTPASVPKQMPKN